MLANEQFAKGIDKPRLRTLAKKNAFLIMATQSLQEIANSPDLCNHHRQHPQPHLPSKCAGHDACGMYRDLFQLNDEQINRIRNAMPKRNYYIVTPKLSRMVDVALPQEIMAVVRSIPVLRRCS